MTEFLISVVGEDEKEVSAVYLTYWCYLNYFCLMHHL